MQNLNKIWFKRKLYGWGWTPATWQGWLVILVYIILFVFILNNLNDSFNLKEMIFKIILPCFVLVSLLIFICYKKGEKPRWQWGKDLGDK